MKTRRILGLLLALVMLVALFAACAPNETTDDTGDNNTATNDTDNQTDDTKDEDEEDEADDLPQEIDAATLSFLSYEAHGTYLLSDCMKYTTYKNMAQTLLDVYNVQIDYTIMESTVYESTLNTFIAGNNLTDIFYSGYLSDSVVNTCISRGIFADMEQILASSDGTAYGMFSDGATFNFIKGMNIRDDGNWYTCHTAASAYTNINLDTDRVDYVCNFPIGCFYGVQIRYDWLQKLGLAVPSNTDEYLAALVAFQEEDVNENGSKDERAFLCLGTNTVYVGVGGWFGLTNGNFVFSVEDGSIQSAILQGDRYTAFANYMARLYDAGVVLNGEGSMWNRQVEVTGNYVSSYQQYPNSTYNETVTGVESLYYPISVIQALDGVRPTLQGQADVVGYTAYAFNVNTDYDAAARWMDFIHSEYFFEMLYFGVEGKAWDWEDGKVTSYTLSDEDALEYRGMWTYMTWTAFPQVDTSIVYHYNAVMYDSIQAAIDNGEPYTSGGFDSYEAYLEKNSQRRFTEEGSNLYCYFIDVLEFGVENIDWTCAATFRAAYTNDEIDRMGVYQTDITTYFDELNINYITGAKSTDTYDEDIQFAYDNLNLQEYINCMQAASNRYLQAVGRDTIPLG